MTSPHLRACPARGVFWVGLLFSVLALFMLKRAILPVQAAFNLDDPLQTITESPPASAENTASISPPSTAVPSHTSSLTAISSETAQVSPSPSSTPEPSPEASLTATITPASASTPTAPVLPTSTEGIHYPPGSLLISEVAWAGTLASANDEWIELFNPGGSPISLEGWILTDNADIHIPLSISIGPFSFALLERTDDSTVANIPADQIYTGSLKNSGDSLFLLDPAGGIVDSANSGGAGWPAGESASRASMERRGGEDRPGNWATFAGYAGSGMDSLGNAIAGTPRGVNSIHLTPSTIPASTGSPTPPTATGTALAIATQTVVFEPGAVLINEVAWAGTAASANDEWIELYNPGEIAISLEGWRLQDEGDLNIMLGGTIPPHGYYLLERSDEQTIADMPADFIYSGSLSNTGEILRLLDGSGNLIDSANFQGGSWPAGNHNNHASMERRGGEDRPGNWATFTGYNGVGRDAAGSRIQGTPRQINSIFFPTPQPTWIPGKVVINEVLIRPHYDWEGRGGVDTGDEFIELLNLGPLPVNLRGWALDDIEGAGSKPYALPAKILAPGAFAVFFRSRTHIALNDGGDSVRLLAPDGRLVDQLQYLRVRAYNLSFGRLPDGSGHLLYGLWPTPGQPNLLFDEPSIGLEIESTMKCFNPSGFTLPLARLGRHPTLVSRLSSQGYRLCWRSG